MRTKPQRSASIKTTPQAIRRSARAIAVEPFILISDSKAKSNDSRCGRSHDRVCVVRRRCDTSPASLSLICKRVDKVPRYRQPAQVGGRKLLRFQAIDIA